MSREMIIPFALNEDGSIGETTSLNKQVLQHVESLVGTYPGERVMLPEYGVPLASYLFEPNNDIQTQEIQLDVERAMRTWESGINVHKVIPVPDRDQLNIMRLEVNYSRTTVAGQANSAGTGRYNTAVVHVGGQVTEFNNG